MYIFIKRHTQLNVHVHFDTGQNRFLIESCDMTSDNQLRQGFPRKILGSKNEILHGC